MYSLPQVTKANLERLGEHGPRAIVSVEPEEGLRLWELVHRDYAVVEPLSGFRGTTERGGTCESPQISQEADVWSGTSGPVTRQSPARRVSRGFLMLLGCLVSLRFSSRISF